MKLSISKIEENGIKKVLFLASGVRVSYPRLWEEEQKGKNRFKKGLQILFPKDDPDAVEAVEKLQSYIDEVVIPKEFDGRELPDEDVCLKDGDRKGGKERFKDHWYLSTNQTNSQVVVFAPGGHTPMSRAEYDQLPENQKFVDGCWGTVKFQMWAQDNDYGKKINGELLAVRWSKADDPLPSESSVSKDAMASGFEDEEVDEGEEW